MNFNVMIKYKMIALILEEIEAHMAYGVAQLFEARKCQDDRTANFTFPQGTTAMGITAEMTGERTGETTGKSNSELYEGN